MALIPPNERGQMLPRQGEMGENTPFTMKFTLETLERITTHPNFPVPLHVKAQTGLVLSTDLFCGFAFNLKLGRSFQSSFYLTMTR